MHQHQPESVLSTDSAGRPIAPSTGVFPILLELEPGTLKVVGTAFFITTYGLFLTAAHVLFDVFDRDRRQKGPLFGLQTEEEHHYLRPVTRFSHHNVADVALGELDNFKRKFPLNPLQNMRGILRKRRPTRDQFLVTYAYPENRLLVFKDTSIPVQLSADFFSSRYRRFVKESDYPFRRYPHFEMSVRIRSGASGGPVFDADGGICGVAVRSWDFDGGEFAGDELSYAVPIGDCMDLGLEDLLIPDGSWEQRQMPSSVAGRKVRVRNLIDYGHILFE